MDDFERDQLNSALHDVRADMRCRAIAKGLAKTSFKAALDYALGYTQRCHCERPIVNEYKNDI